MSRSPRKKKGDVFAGILLLFLVTFLSGRIFSAGWDEFYATAEFVKEGGREASPGTAGGGEAFLPLLAPGSSMVSDPAPLRGDGGRGLGIGGLAYLQRGYPDVNFARSWDPEREDWVVSVTVPADGKGPGARTADFYWQGGSLLPEEELGNADSYWPVLYDYPKVLADPADMSGEEQAAIREFSSAENRRDGAGTSMFFFDFLYQSDTRGHLEAQLTSVSFLGHRANVHRRMVAPLARVEERVRALAAEDKEVASFLSGIKSNDSYLWRVIAGTKRKSFHSLGIAVDVLPKSQGGKQIFWSWAKDKHPDDWMLIPLKDRWMPPERVVEAFEEEGFIWGGKWAIYDNMHFEYHPELIEYNFRR